MRLWKTSRRHLVAFCERCAQVCDARCRASALRDDARSRVLRYAGRLV